MSDLGRPIDAVRADTLRRDLKRMERFRSGLATAFPWPHTLAATLPDDTVVCRCEVIAAGDLREVATNKGALELNRVKALSRIGMGRCQGRYCGHAAAEIIAAATGQAVEHVGRLRGQAPVKPLALVTRSAASGRAPS